MSEYGKAIEKLVAAGASRQSAEQLCARISSSVFCREVDAIISFMNSLENDWVDRSLEALASRPMMCMNCEWTGTAADLIERDQHLDGPLPIDKRFCPQCRSVRVMDRS